MWPPLFLSVHFFCSSEAQRAMPSVLQAEPYILPLSLETYIPTYALVLLLETLVARWVAVGNDIIGGDCVRGSRGVDSGWSRKTDPPNANMSIRSRLLCRDPNAPVGNTVCGYVVYLHTSNAQLKPTNTPSCILPSLKGIHSMPVCSPPVILQSKGKGQKRPPCSSSSSNFTLPTLHQAVYYYPHGRHHHRHQVMEADAAQTEDE